MKPEDRLLKKIVVILISALIFSSGKAIEGLSTQINLESANADEPRHDENFLPKIQIRAQCASLKAQIEAKQRALARLLEFPPEPKSMDERSRRNAESLHNIDIGITRARIRELEQKYSKNCTMSAQVSIQPGSKLRS